MLIELARGEQKYQPMASITIHALPDAPIIALAEKQAAVFEQHGFPVSRIKIEIPADDAKHLQQKITTDPYFEWHGKVPFTDTEKLLACCLQHGAHLSKNALHEANDTRFVTLRERGDEQLFYERCSTLLRALENGGWKPTKQDFEYCFYDTHRALDNGWLNEVPGKTNDHV